MCETAESRLLLPFFQGAFALAYEEKPNYDSLRFALLGGLLEINQVPTLHYDWMKNSGMRTGAVRWCQQLSAESIEMLDVGELDQAAADGEPVSALSELMASHRNYNFAVLRHGAQEEPIQQPGE